MAYIKNKWSLDTFQKGDKALIDGLNHMEDGISEGGGGGEPAQYLKDAVKEGNKLIITKKDGSTVEYVGGGEPEAFLKDAAVNAEKLTIIKKDGSAVEFDISGKLDKPVEPVAGQGINVPYFFEVEYHETDAIVKDHTIDLLDKTKAPQQFQMRITAASAQQAGLLQAGDKLKLDILNQVEANPTLAGEEQELTSIQIGENKFKIPEGGSGEPAAYIKEASVANEKLTLTKKDGSTVEFDVSSKANQTDLDLEKDARVRADDELQEHIDAKQDKLTAGANITISEDNVISATGSGSVDSVTVGGEKLTPVDKDIKIVLGNSLVYNDQEPGLGYKNLHVNFKSTHGLEVDGTNGLKVKVNQESGTISLDANGLKVADAVVADIANKAKLPDKLPEELRVEGVEYPWFMINLNPKSIDADGNLILDHSGYNFNTKQYYTWKDKSIPMVATESTGGLMKASDAKALRTDLPTAINNEIVRAKGVEAGLDTRVQNLESRGRFLSSWDVSTGLPADYPTIEKGGKYSYRAGDYYIISSIPASGDKYQPDGIEITRDTEGNYNVPKKAETREIGVGDYYNYTTSGWVWIQNTQKTVNFSQIAGEARNNINLKSELETLEAADNTLGGRISTLEGISHSHSNKILLDSYDQTNADIEAAVQQRHSHSNKDELDLIASGDKTKWDNAANKSHNHINKATLDDIHTENLLDAGQKDKLTAIEAGAQVNKIEVVKVDDVALDISNKAVNINLNNKLDKPNEPVTGQGVNVPYFFDVNYAADKVTVKDYTIDLLDKSKAPQQFSIDINCATQSNAGLLSAADKKKIDDGELPQDPTDTDAEYVLATKYVDGVWVKYWKEIANKSDIVDKGMVDYMVLKQ